MLRRFSRVHLSQSHSDPRSLGDSDQVGGGGSATTPHHEHDAALKE
jgi:hypothetical protein